jgi:arginase
MTRTLALIGVPSSAGAHYPGQEKAPQHLRNAGLIQRLASAGMVVVDYGDLPRVRCPVDRKHRHTQSLSAVVDVARSLADRIDIALQAQQIPLVIGGDCTITLGMLSAFLRHHGDVALLYIDGGMDITTPATYRLGILDSMGVAHMVAEDGSIEELSHIGPRYPLMPGENIVPFGYNPGEPVEHEQATLAQHRIHGYPVAAVRGRARETATKALKVVEGKADRFVIHFDVDVLDFVDFPVADVLQPHQGLTFEEAMLSLSIFTASSKFAGLAVTEFNPDHDDEEGSLAEMFIDGLARALFG